MSRNPRASTSKEVKSRCDAVSASEKRTYKLIGVLGRKVELVIDSASDLHLEKSSLYVSFKEKSARAHQGNF